MTLIRLAPKRVVLFTLPVAAVVAVVAYLVVAFVVPARDPAGPARSLALREARAAGHLDYAQMWRERSSCWQAHHPDEAAWEREVQTGQSSLILPADTRYEVVQAIQVVQDGASYWRVEVRITPPPAVGINALDYEVDIAPIGGRLAVVDTGPLQHTIQDDCKGGFGR
jgi:hypothetical protein